MRGHAQREPDLGQPPRRRAPGVRATPPAPLARAGPGLAVTAPPARARAPQHAARPRAVLIHRLAQRVCLSNPSPPHLTPTLQQDDFYAAEPPEHRRGCFVCSHVQPLAHARAPPATHAMLCMLSNECAAPIPKLPARGPAVRLVTTVHRRLRAGRHTHACLPQCCARTQRPPAPAQETPLHVRTCAPAWPTLKAPRRAHTTPPFIPLRPAPPPGRACWR